MAYTSWCLKWNRQTSWTAVNPYPITRCLWGYCVGDRIIVTMEIPARITKYAQSMEFMRVIRSRNLQYIIWISNVDWCLWKPSLNSSPCLTADALAPVPVIHRLFQIILLHGLTKIKQYQSILFRVTSSAFGIQTITQCKETTPRKR